MSNRDMSLGGIQIAAPNWAGDFLGRDALMPGAARIDPTGFAAYAGPVIVTLTAAAAVGAVSLAVTALTAAIPAGTVLNFGVNGKFAVVAQNVAAAAVAIPVLPIDQALVIGDVANYPGTYGTKVIPSGTFVSRTFAQRNAGVGFHAAIVGEDEFFLIAFDVPNALVNDEIVLVRPQGCVVKENFLPGYSAMSAGILAALRAAYRTTLGAE